MSTQPTITLYTAPDCVQCGSTKRRLEKKGLTWNEVDTSVDEAARDMLKARGFLQNPVLHVQHPRHDRLGTWWTGFRPDLIDHLAAELTEPYLDGALG